MAKTCGKDMLTCPHLAASLHLYVLHRHAPHPLHKPFCWPLSLHASVPCHCMPCGCTHRVALPLAAARIASLCPLLCILFPIVPSLIFSHKLRPHKVSNEFQPNSAIVVYDVTKAASLEKAKMWKELQQQVNLNIIIALTTLYSPRGCMHCVALPLVAACTMLPCPRLAA